jgi:hypothetical protein
VDSVQRYPHGGRLDDAAVRKGGIEVSRIEVG